MPALILLAFVDHLILIRLFWLIDQSLNDGFRHVIALNLLLGSVTFVVFGVEFEVLLAGRFVDESVDFLGNTGRSGTV